MYGIYANIWGVLMVKYGKCYHIWILWDIMIIHGVINLFIIIHNKYNNYRYLIDPF